MMGDYTSRPRLDAAWTWSRRRPWRRGSRCWTRLPSKPQMILGFEPQLGGSGLSTPTRRSFRVLSGSGERRPSASQVSASPASVSWRSRRGRRLIRFLRRTSWRRTLKSWRVRRLAAISASSRGAPISLESCSSAREVRPPQRFKVGRDVAATPDQVVARTELAEVIQHTPTTDKVHAEPDTIPRGSPR